MILDMLKGTKNECAPRSNIRPLQATFVLYWQYWIVIAYQKTKLTLFRLLAIGRWNLFKNELNLCFACFKGNINTKDHERNY